MYVNGKMILVESVPGMGEIKENSGGGWIQVLYLIHCKNLCKCHNVLPTIKSV
jgi:hypothetical protein